MTTIFRTIGRSATVTTTLIIANACSQLGQLGNVLGTGTPQASQVSGVVQGVDTRSQQIVLQQSNGQNIGLLFDSQTQVTYQNRSYSVTNLERGDRVTARITQANNGSGYYTDLVQVDQSVSGSGGTVYQSNGSVEGGTVQSLQGTVRQVDRRNGVFTLDVGNYNTLTVSLPYNARQDDSNRFQSLRSGDQVRFYGVFLNNNRVELRRFY
jgi:Cu/Ag efflux protein CusF